MSTRRPMIAGNWKMNLSGAEALALAGGLAEKIAENGEPSCDVVVCPPAVWVKSVADDLDGSVIGVGSQDCHSAVSGAHTGDVAAAQVKDAGADYAIVGHSERRTDHSESSTTVRAKAEAAYGAGLTAIICVGETREQRDMGATLAVVAEQTALSVPDGATAANTVIAYEPVWAIGTGLVPTVADVAEVHAALRDQLVARFGTEGEGMRLLYGGSVKPSNAAELLSVADVDGALVGGASLKVDDFWGIIASIA